MSPAYLRHGSRRESPNCHGKTQKPSWCRSNPMEKRRDQVIHECLLPTSLVVKAGGQRFPKYRCLSPFILIGQPVWPNQCKLYHQYAFPSRIVLRKICLAPRRRPCVCRNSGSVPGIVSLPNPSTSQIHCYAATGHLSSRRMCYRHWHTFEVLSWVHN
jgi:hypothetical protein